MRLPNWENDVLAYFEQHRMTRFEWGVFDCCSFAADVVKRATGVDYYEAFSGHYTTERGAIRALRKYGHKTLQNTLQHALGDVVAPLQLRRGDLALVKNDGLLGQALAVCWSGGLIMPGEYGLVQLPFPYATCGWRVD